MRIGTSLAKRNAPEHKETPLFPNRYIIKTEGEFASLSCLESPNIAANIVRGKTVTPILARKSPPRTIYLDGAAQGEPFIDTEKLIFNLDHHEGCVRSFTLSTCEQAMIMVCKGLSLSEKNWMIWANEPDLDTILAIWILLNHHHLKLESSALKQILPLLRLEGLIDSIGLELQSLTAFPNDLQKTTSRHIDILREKELQLKQFGNWDDVDYPSYTTSVLYKIDQLVYRVEDFSEFKGMEELARVEVNESVSVVVYKAQMGIYEVEAELNRLYSKKSDIIVLQRNERHYTIRKSDLFLPYDLDFFYERLNLMDGAVSGRNPENRWGGSGEIGGSPRLTGTKLTPHEIANICKQTFQKPSYMEIFFRSLLALFFTGATAGLGWLAVKTGMYLNWFYNGVTTPYWSKTITYTPIVFLTSLLFTLILSRRKKWVYGFRYPAGWDWWLIFAMMLPAGFFGGAAFTDTLSILNINRSLIETLFALIVFPIGVELFLRSGIHGLFIGLFRIQMPESRWFISFPALISAIIGSLFFWISPATLIFPPTFIPNFWQIPIQYSSIFIFSILSGMIRERSESIFPSIAFHIATISIIAYSMIFFI